MLDAEFFRRSPRMSAILKVLFEQSINNPGIALPGKELFRSSAFPKFKESDGPQPQINRLRKALKKYYHQHPKQDVYVHVPHGKYLLEFSKDLPPAEPSPALER